MDFKNIFPKECQKELVKRFNGDTRYGPPTVHSLVFCKEPTIRVNDNWTITRPEASRFVIWVDLAILLVFIFAIYKLKDYQDMSIQDYKNGQLRINDFTVLIPEIPVSPNEYNNNPELLKAMVASHIEEIIAGETQQIESLEEI